MSPLSLIVALLALSVFAYYFGRRRAFAMAGGRSRSLHSRPGYYGAYVALWCALPALGVFFLWLMIQPTVTESIAISALPDAMRNLGPDRMSLLLNDIRNVADGAFSADRAAPEVAAAAAHLNRLNATGTARSRSSRWRSRSPVSPSPGPASHRRSGRGTGSRRRSISCSSRARRSRS